MRENVISNVLDKIAQICEENNCGNCPIVKWCEDKVDVNRTKIASIIENY